MHYSNNSSPRHADGWQLKPSVLQSFVSFLKQQVTNSIKGDLPFWEKHNTYTLYCVSLLMFATGHRSVRDPFETPSQFLVQESLALINDKVTHEDRSWRLVALPKVAQDQLAAYNKHLRSVGNLTQTVPKNGRALAAEIHALLAKQKSVVPYFFLLTEDLKTLSIRPKHVDAFWSQFAQLNKSLARHTLASDLGASGIEPSHTLATMGHAVGLEHWAGHNSELTPADVMRTVGEHTQTSLTTAGWEALNGIRKYNTSAYKPQKHESMFSHESDEFGIALRTKQRQKLRNEELQLTQKLVHDIIGTAPTHISREQLNTLFSSVEATANANERSAGNALTHLMSILYDYKKAGVTIERFDWRLPLSTEASPFNADTLKNYDYALTLQEKWRQLLSNAHRNNLLSSNDMQIAALILTVALEEAYVDASTLYNLCNFSNCRTYHSNGVIHVEFYNAENEWLTRWCPSTATLPLLIGCLKISTAPEPKQVKKALRSLLKQLNVTSPRNTDPAAKLWRIYQFRSLVTLPGYARALLTDGRAHLPPTVLARIVSHEPLKPIDTDQQPSHEPDTAWLPELRSQTHNRLHRVIKKDLQGLFSAIDADRSAGTIHGNKAINTHLAKGLKNLSEQQPQAPQIAHLVIAWGAYLCTHGTRKKRSPALGTLQTYIPLVSNSLAAVVGCDDFLNYSEAQYNETYMAAIELGAQEDQKRLVGQLQHFHEFLVTYYCVEDTEWGGIWATARTANKRVSANLVTYCEYERMLDAIAADLSLTPENRTQYQTLIITLYRFGLRFGEAYRLQPRHFQFSEDYSDIIIHVTSSVFGTTKTEAGIRNVYGLEQLTQREIDVLKLCLEAAEAATLDDQQTGLMTQHTSQRGLIDRGRASYYLNQLLKRVTGDDSSHLHHFRHGFATRTYAAITQNQLPQLFDWEHHNIKTERLSEAGFPEPLKCLAQILGHTGFLTTAQTYIHSWANSRIAEPTIRDTLSDKSLATMLLVDENTLAQRKKRNPDKDPIDLEIKKLKLPSIADGLIIAYEPIKAEETYSQYNQPLRPSQIESIFYRVIMQGGNAQRLAAFYGQTETNFSALMQVAENLERATGIDEHRFFARVQDERYNSALSEHPSSKRHHAEHLRLQTWLHKFETKTAAMNDEALEQMRTLLHRWQQMMVPRSLRVAVVSQADFDDFIELLTNLDSMPSHIGFNAPRNTDTFNCHQLNELGVGYSYTTRHNAPRAKEKSKNRRMQGVGLDLSKLPDHIGNQRTLYRGLFILSVWFEYGAQNNSI